MKKNENGFSLVELLVVVIIIGIVAAIAIPNLLASRRAANDASAVSSLRTYHSANSTYLATIGNSTSYASDFTDLAPLVDAILAGSTTPQKSGYNFAYTTDANDTIYCATATPITPGSTGDHVYAVSSDGVIYASALWDGAAYPGGAPACAAGVLTANGGTPLAGGGAAPAPAPAPGP